MDLLNQDSLFSFLSFLSLLPPSHLPSFLVTDLSAFRSGLQSLDCQGPHAGLFHTRPFAHSHCVGFTSVTWEACPSPLGTWFVVSLECMNLKMCFYRWIHSSRSSKINPYALMPASQIATLFLDYLCGILKLFFFFFLSNLEEIHNFHAIGL